MPKIESNIKVVKKNTLFMTKTLEKSTKFALNDAIKQARTAGRQEIRFIYNIKAGDIRKAVKIKKASFIDLAATLSYISRRRSLLSFGAKQFKYGVRVKVVKAGGFKKIKHAFVQEALRGGGRAVLIRKIVSGDRVGRYPIEGRQGPSQSEMANNPRVGSVIMKRASSAYDRRLKYHIDRINKRIKKTQRGVR